MLLYRQDHRAQTHEQGLAAEAAAGCYLFFKGYRILARRYRTPVGEIDLIARKGNVTVFVEVKWRPTAREGLEAIHSKAQERLRRAAEQYLAGHPKAQNAPTRFDVVVISPNAWPHHVKDAFH